MTYEAAVSEVTTTWESLKSERGYLGQSPESSVETGGRTFREWISSYNAFLKASDWEKNDELYRLAPHFKKLLLIPDFIKLFHKSRLHLQLEILTKLSHGDCPWTSFYYLKLLHDTKSDFRLMHSWIRFESHLHKAETKTHLDLPSEVIRGKIFRLDEQINKGKRVSHDWASDLMTLGLLSMKLGEDKFQAIADLWLDHKPEGEMYRLLQIADNWDFYHDQPLTWSVHVVDPDECFTNRESRV